MEPFRLMFDSRIPELEKENRWETIAKIVTQQWEERPNDLNCLLCAGTQLWYTLLVMDDIRNDPFPPEHVEFASEEQLQNDLMRVTRCGLEHFSDSAVFNAYFGYMMETMPYFFPDYRGDYQGWRAKGLGMMRKSNALDPTNPFAVAMCYEPDAYGKNSSFHLACKALWESVTPEQWGTSEVQQYFFRILHGDVFYPNAYPEYT